MYTCMSIIIYITTESIRVERSDSRTELRLLKELSITHYFYTVTTYYNIYLDMYKYCNMRITDRYQGHTSTSKPEDIHTLYMCMNKDIIKNTTYT